MLLAASSGLRHPFKRPRTSSSDESESQCLKKKPKYYYILAPETTTDEGSSDSMESIYSIQGQTTDLAKDTSDTSSSGDDSVVEYEVVSLSDERIYPFTMEDSSPSPEEIIYECEPAIKLAFSDAESSKESAIIPPDNVKDCPRRLYLFINCIQCGNKNPLPYFRYCDKCYKVRKNFFPPRPKGRKNRYSLKCQKKPGGEVGEMKLSGDSGIGSEGSHILSEEVREEKARSEAKGDGDKDPSQGNELCSTCLVRPKNGGYVHKNIVHVYSCYQCSVKIMKFIGRCPICNLKVNQVCKVITF